MARGEPLLRAGALLKSSAAEMNRALSVGGTTLDLQYINVNGESGAGGHFRAVYGLAGRPCKRCGTPIVREKFMNRSSHVCPICQ